MACAYFSVSMAVLEEMHNSSRGKQFLSTATKSIRGQSHTTIHLIYLKISAYVISIKLDKQRTKYWNTQKS